MRSRCILLLAAACAACGDHPLPAQVTIRPGDVIDGVLDSRDAPKEYGGYYDSYQVTGRPGDRVRIDARSADVEALLEWGYMENRGWRRVSVRGGEQGNDTHLVVTLVEGRTLELRVSTYGDPKEGRYQLAVSDPGPIRLHPVRAGDRIEGTLGDGDAEGDRGLEDNYLLTGRPGEVVTVVVESDAFDPVVQALPEGTFAARRRWAGRPDENARLIVPIESGPRGQRVIVQSMYEKPGPYVLRVVAGAVNGTPAKRDGRLPFEDPDHPAGLLRENRVIEGTLTDDPRSGDFTLGAGQSAVIYASSDDFDPVLTASVGLSNFVPVASDDNGWDGRSARLDFSPAQGMQVNTIRVSSAEPGRTGKFRVIVTSDSNLLY